MKYFCGSPARISSALAIAPGMPLGPSVKINSAPYALSIRRRSRDMVSGIVRTNGYCLAAQTNARAIPVLPLVGSITVTSFCPGFSFPCASAAQIIGPNPALYRIGGVTPFDLSHYDPGQPCRDSIDAYQRRSADAQAVIIKYLSHLDS